MPKKEDTHTIINLNHNPEAGLRRIRPEAMRVQPLSDAQFEMLLAAIEPFFGSRTGIGSNNLAAEFDALFSFQRHSGLRLRDAVAFPRSGLVGNRITLTMQKTKAATKYRVIPDDVAAKLAALSEGRPGFLKGYFFWFAGASSLESLTSRWNHHIDAFSNVLQFTNEAGKPLRFHNRMLRDTFAVDLLLRGVALEDVSMLLTHRCVTTTEKYYGAWIELARRQRYAQKGVGRVLAAFFGMQ